MGSFFFFPLVGRLSMDRRGVPIWLCPAGGPGWGRAYARETGCRDLAVAMFISVLIGAVVFGHMKPRSEVVSVILAAVVLSLVGSYLLAQAHSR